MLTLEDRERLTDVQEQLLRLYVLRRYATEDGNARKLRAINKEIAPLETERRSIRGWRMSGAA